MTYINFTVPPYPHFCYSGNATYRPGDKHRARKGIPFFDLIAVETGNLSIMFHENNYTLTQNSILIIPPDTPHRGMRICTEKTVFHWMHFRAAGNFALSDAPSRAPQPENNLLNDNFYTISFPVYQRVPDEIFQNVLSTMIRLETRDINFFIGQSTISKSTNSLLLQQELFFNIMNALAFKTGSNSPNEIAYQAIQYFNAHYDEQVSLETLAQKLSCHPTHLIRCVKKQYGCPPTQMLIRIRLQRACELLSTTDESVTSIAYSVGFSSASYFCKQFKKNLGCSPHEYRSLITSPVRDSSE